MDLGIYKSIDELYFSWYLDELIEEGFVHQYDYESWGWELTEAQSIKKIEVLKTKKKLVDRNLLARHTYGCDFGIVFTDKARYYFIEFIYRGMYNINAPFFIAETEIGPGIHRAYVEVKPYFDQNNMTRLFTINQKWVLSKHNCYVNLIIPYGKDKNCLFAKTFTPKKVIATEVYSRSDPRYGYVKGQSKIKYKMVRSLDDYLREVRAQAKFNRWGHVFKLEQLKLYKNV